MRMMLINFFNCLQDDQCGTSLRRLITAEPYNHPAKSIQFNIEPADTGLVEACSSCCLFPVSSIMSVIPLCMLIIQFAC